MNLRKKTFFSILAATTIIMGIFGILARTVFLDSYRDMEIADARSEIHRLNTTLNNNMANLNASTSDWAAWDDTYQYFQDRNQKYLRSNMVNNTFQNLGINLAIFLDNEGNVIYEKAYDLENQQVLPVSDDLMPTIRESFDLSQSGEDSPQHGMIALHDTPLMISIAPVLTSLNEGPSRGTLIFGQFLTGDAYNRIKDVVSNKLSIISYEPGLISNERPRVVEDLNQSEDTYINFVNDQKMEIYYLIKNNAGDPLFIIEIQKDRSIYQQGLISTNNMILTIIMACLTAGGILLTILDQNMLTRLGELIQNVSKFRLAPEKDFSTALSGNDELSHLSHEVNLTLHHLLIAQNQLKLNFDYENYIVDISTQFINLPINKIDAAIQFVLETSGKQIQAEAGLIFFYRKDWKNNPIKSYEWQTEQRYSLKDKMKAQFIHPFEWGRNQYYQGEKIIFSDFEDLPDAALVEKKFCRENHILSGIGVPLKFSNDLYGMIFFVVFSHFHKWDDQTVNIIEILANILANAIDRRENEEQLQLSQQFQFRLNQITQTSIAKDTSRASLHSLSKHLKNLIGSDRGILVLTKRKNAAEIFESGRRRPLNSNFNRMIRYLVKNGSKKALVFDTANKEELKNIPELNWLGKTIITLPLMGKNQHLGWIILSDSNDHPFTNLELNICRQAASQITLSIIKILSLEESQEISNELRNLRVTIADISAELDLQKLRETILERASKLIKGEAGVFFTFNENIQALEISNFYNIKGKYNISPIKPGEGALGRAIQLKKTIYVRDYATWKYHLSGHNLDRIKSAIATPLMIGDQILGGLVVFRLDQTRNFTKNDQHLLNIFAQHASIAIENATLFEKIQEMARQDEVTGLLNRRALYEVGKYELDRALRLNCPIAVAMVDLDNYKEINDTYNHLVGDKVLQEVARLFRENVRNIDIVGRYGGDECVIIMPETEVENAFGVVERIRNILEHQAIEVDDIQFHLTACFGISAYHDKPPSIEKIIDEADTAMYAAKAAGRNAIRIYQNL